MHFFCVDREEKLTESGIFKTSCNKRFVACYFNRCSIKIWDKLNISSKRQRERRYWWGL